MSPPNRYLESHSSVGALYHRVLLQPGQLRRPEAEFPNCCHQTAEAGEDTPRAAVRQPAGEYLEGGRGRCPPATQSGFEHGEFVTVREERCRGRPPRFGRAHFCHFHRRPFVRAVSAPLDRPVFCALGVEGIRFGVIEPATAGQPPRTGAGRPVSGCAPAPAHAGRCPTPAPPPPLRRCRPCCQPQL